MTTNIRKNAQQVDQLLAEHPALADSLRKVEFGLTTTTYRVFGSAPEYELWAHVLKPTVLMKPKHRWIDGDRPALYEREMRGDGIRVVVSESLWSST